MVRSGRFPWLRIIVSLGVGALILGGLMLDARAQEPEQPTIQKALRSSTLPGDWLGTWRGTVRNQRSDSEPNEFEMELTIAPTGSPNELQWKIVYEGPQGKSERDYRIYSGESKGHFVIDEQNGIRIDAVLFENTLLSHFRIQSQTLWTKYERSASSESPEIRFELIAADNQNKTVTQATGLDISVESLRASSRQTAILKRVESPTSESEIAGIPAWRKLETDAYRGKQDDIYFVDENIGWYVNGDGKIYKSVDGGEKWTLQWHHPGTYFRCIAFLDQQHGFAGNIGPGYFPNVSDPTPLYETKDGGSNWTPVENIEGAPVIGLCALQVLREPYVNAGQLETRTRMIGVGRVGGPTAMIFSDDMGASWQQLDISSHAAMAFDVHFWNRNEGLIAAASHADVSQSHALILATSDGGKTWRESWRSNRPYELTWKISFPTRDTGYVTIQSYDPDPAVKERFVAKTTDGGSTWKEIRLSEDPRVREFGIAFLNPSFGWVGAVPHGFQTTDGGATWAKVDMGNAVNKIRLIPSSKGHVGFAIGTQVHRIDLPKSN